jgi:sn-glycerol 3-phosphate transport system ATP-binding protein
MASISIDRVRKVYPGGVEAIPAGLAVEIEDGELCVLVGPSGCGKSTLLRMVAGLEAITDGEIRIGERRVNELEPAERDIAMVFQNYALYPHMSVYDNMAYGLKNRGTRRDEIRARVEEAAGLLGIGDFLSRKPRQLSGGQRQRVAMGRAIVRKPQVFLFDEPLSNLDAKLRIRTRVEIRALQQRLATTAIYVTHDQLEAMTLADKLVVMNAGRIEQIGPPTEVYAHPATVFVAGFIGSPPMNLLPGVTGPEGTALENGARVCTEARPAGEVTVGIRPEDLHRAADGPIAITVKVVEQLGAAINVHGTLEGTGTEIIANLSNDDIPEPGSLMKLEVSPGAVHRFDPATGRRSD